MACKDHVVTLLDLACLHSKHRVHILSTSFLIPGQKKFSASMSNVFGTPKCPISPPQCASRTNTSRKEQLGIHNLFSLKRNPSWRLNLSKGPNLQSAKILPKSTSLA